MFGLPFVDVITIILYFAVVLIIGIWASRRIKNQEDYFLGGRRFGNLCKLLLHSDKGHQQRALWACPFW